MRVSTGCLWFVVLALMLPMSSQACGCGGAGISEYKWSPQERLEHLCVGVVMTLAVFGGYAFMHWLAKFSSKRVIAWTACLALLNVVLTVGLFDSGADLLFGIYRIENAMLLQITLALLPVLHGLYQLISRFKQAY